MQNRGNLSFQHSGVVGSKLTRDPVNKIKVERDYKRAGGSFQQK